MRSKKICIVLTLLLSLVFYSDTTVYSQVTIQPKNLDSSSINENGWFKYIVDPGQTIESEVLLSNLEKSDISVQIRSNDFTITEDGAFTIVANEVENKSLGSWVELDPKEITIPAEQSLSHPFKINVPLDIKPGEYAGGISVLPSENIGNSSLAVKTRLGVRIYLIVKGDLQVQTETRDLSILSPKSSNFIEEVRRRNYIRSDNMVLKFSAQNGGNTFSKLSGDIEIKLPDGRELKQKFSRDLAPGVGWREFYIETKESYQTGKTRVKINYSTAVQNTYTQPLEVSLVNDKGTMETEVELSEEDVQSFLVLSEQIQEPAQENQSAMSGGGLMISTVDETKQAGNWWMFYWLAPIALVIIVSVIYWIYMKRKRVITVTDKSK